MTPAPSYRWGEHLVYTTFHEGRTYPVQRHIDVIQGTVMLLTRSSILSCLVACANMLHTIRYIEICVEVGQKCESILVAGKVRESRPGCN